MAVKKKKLYKHAGVVDGQVVNLPHPMPEAKKPPTLEQRHDPVLTQAEKASGAFASELGTAQLPSGTEVSYTPQTIQVEELQGTTGALLGTTPTATAGQMKKFPKAAKNPNSRLRQARRRWRC